MVYQIYFMPENAPVGSRGYTMFDIEYYMKRSENPPDIVDIGPSEWYSEIHCLPCVDGLSYFIEDKLGKIDLDEFVKEATEIQEIRGLLYERLNNMPKQYELAREFHYEDFGKKLRKMLDDFCEKYGLYLSID